MTCHLCNRETPGTHIAGFLHGNPVCADCDHDLAQPAPTPSHIDALAELFSESRTHRQKNHFSNHIYA